MLCKTTFNDLTVRPLKGELYDIQSKTGKSPDDFKELANAKGFAEKGKLKSGVKAGQIVEWLKQDFDLGRGHAMAIYALLKGDKDENSK
ncbi:MAG: DUF4287 domain-containing protein [Leptolyngbyaceae cyanobacterium SU_3_3]|nr:DUF4287 domain-containing protein [Leptolyngbyaceae cyanobacterium SU_3_3]NJR51455.1 DUF4287 domain-containing protein [Leptolyngbyaceae cyanobacterium CSU_1_3]